MTRLAYGRGVSDVVSPEPNAPARVETTGDVVMTVRTAELLVAVALAVLSIGIMFKSTDGLAIGWVPETGPGSGAWPFWLSTGMLLSCLVTIARWFRGITPESRSQAAFLSAEAAHIVGITIAALFLLLLGSYIIGIYFSICLFLIFYLRFFGGHGWILTLTLAVVTPIALFFFFEGALVIPLPKAYSEPLFYPLYDIIY
jgi:putative tricarboxylic transport membrane protein